MFSTFVSFIDVFTDKSVKAEVSKTRVVRPVVLEENSTSVNSLLNLVKVIENNASVRLNKIEERLTELERQRNELLVERNKISRMLQIALE